MTSTRKQAVLEANTRHVAPQRVRFWEESGIPLVIDRRKGYFLWDIDGHRLYDLHLNGGTFNLGHRNTEVIDSLVGAANSYDIGNHHFPSMARASFASALADRAPGEMPFAVFASGGSEAVDIAIKTARAATGRRRLITLEQGYHGRTGLSGAAGEDGAARYFLSDRPDEFIKVPFGDLEAIETILREDGDIAGVLIETVPATYGFPVIPTGYLKGIADLCREHDILYIADEVQAGLGRSGHLWAVEAHGVKPDILITAKGLSGGIYPIAAVLLTERVAGWLHEYGWGHVSTFGGSEIGCVVGEKVLEITTRPHVVSHVLELSTAMRNELDSLQGSEPYLVEIRQLGLIMGLRFDHPDGAIYVQRELYERGVWAIASGFDHSVLQWKPGLLLELDEVGPIVDRLADAVASAKGHDYRVPRRHRVRSGE